MLRASSKRPKDSNTYAISIDTVQIGPINACPSVEFSGLIRGRLSAYFTPIRTSEMQSRVKLQTHTLVFIAVVCPHEEGIRVWRKAVYPVRVYDPIPRIQRHHLNSQFGCFIVSTPPRHNLLGFDLLICLSAGSVSSIPEWYTFSHALRREGSAGSRSSNHGRQSHGSIASLTHRVVPRQLRDIVILAVERVFGILRHCEAIPAHLITWHTSSWSLLV